MKASRIFSIRSLAFVQQIGQACSLVRIAITHVVGFVRIETQVE